MHDIFFFFFIVRDTYIYGMLS